MKRMLVLIAFVAFLLAAWPNPAVAQGGFEKVTGDAFTKAVPNDFYLEGNRIPVQKLNRVLLKNTKGWQVVVGLLDTSGYSSQIQQKYSGMLITETRVSVCGISLGVGSYGFGLCEPKAPSTDDAKLKIYNQAGDELGECSLKKDASIKTPQPLAVATAKGAPTKLNLFRYSVDIQ